MIYSRHFICALVTVLIASCASKNASRKTSAVNTKFNKEYIASKKSFLGKLNPEQYIEIKTALELELKTKLTEGKTILINYVQNAPNCISVGISKKNMSIVTDNGLRISNEISAKNNAIDFFVFTKDSYNNAILSTREQFILDKGFFHNKVFTLHENCEDFFILKPDGEFMKYYGEDYYTEVECFLSRKKIKEIK